MIASCGTKPPSRKPGITFKKTRRDGNRIRTTHLVYIYERKMTFSFAWQPGYTLHPPPLPAGCSLAIPAARGGRAGLRLPVDDPAARGGGGDPGAVRLTLGREGAASAPGKFPAQAGGKKGFYCAKLEGLVGKRDGENINPLYSTSYRSQNPVYKGFDLRTGSTVERIRPLACRTCAAPTRRRSDRPRY